MENANIDFTSIARGNIDAFLRVNSALSRGAEQLSKNFFSLADRSLQNAEEAANRMVSANIFQQIANVQANYLQQTMDTFVSEAKRGQEVSEAIMKDVGNPIAERTSAAMHAAGSAAPSSGPSGKRAS